MLVIGKWISRIVPFESFAWFHQVLDHIFGSLIWILFHCSSLILYSIITKVSDWLGIFDFIKNHRGKLRKDISSLVLFGFTFISFILTTISLMLSPYSEGSKERNCLPLNNLFSQVLIIWQWEDLLEYTRLQLEFFMFLVVFVKVDVKR